MRTISIRNRNFKTLIIMNGPLLNSNIQYLSTFLGFNMWLVKGLITVCNICTSLHVYVCMYACMRVCVYACMCVCM